MRQRAQEAALAQQAQDRQAQQQYGVQSALSAQGAQQQAALASHQADVQARLQQVTLNQEENMRLQKMYQARASIEDNADLAPSERRQLITQLESGINPLENRQREQQILEASVRTQALAQQNEHQAVLFNQRQARLTQGLGDRIVSLTNPNTGMTQLFMTDLEGNAHPVDFSNSDQFYQARLESLRTQTAGAQQEQGQSAALFGGRLERQGLENAQLGELLNHARTVNPLDVQHRQLVNRQLATTIAQSPARFNLDMMRGYADLGVVQQHLHEQVQSEPYRLDLARANARIATLNAEAHPTDIGLRQMAQQAGILHQNALTQMSAAQLARLPSVEQTRQLHANDLQQSNVQLRAAQYNLERLLEGNIPPNVAATIVDHANAAHNARLTQAYAQWQHAIDRSDPDAARTAMDRVRDLTDNAAQYIHDDVTSRRNTVMETMGLTGPTTPPAGWTPEQSGMPGPNAPTNPPRAGQAGPRPAQPAPLQEEPGRPAHENPRHMNEVQQNLLRNFRDRRAMINALPVNAQRRQQLHQQNEELNRIIQEAGGNVARLTDAQHARYQQLYLALVRAGQEGR